MCTDGWGMPPRGYGSDQASHSHSNSTDYTLIQIQSAGNHTHEIYDETETIGKDEPFSILPPYETINYIIYAD